jgi:ATP-dependent helicase/nuclease subunit A
MAKPQLFLEKYNRFPENEAGADRKIVLSRNFRSRKTILDVANEVFGKIMTKALGGIVYDAANALYYGASFEGEDTPVELLVMDNSKEDNDTLEELADDVNAVELEAEAVALRIRRLYEEGFPITDKTDGSRRPMKYADVAILLRSMGEFAQCYERAFRSQGIPVRCPVKKGCFDSYEVNNILEFLSIIDNPRQDIPLTAVLENIFRFSDEEVAKIKIYGKMDTMYDNVLAILHMEELPEELAEAAEKLQNFRNLLKKYRKEKTYLTIYDLINHILEDTGFEYFILAFPDGTERMTNIAMLKERAAVYQQGSYHGLFHFIRYIEKNQQYEIEQETMSGAGEEDAVTIMSIHKSKGLEYPVTVVGALGKRFNNQDAAKKIVLHQTYGIGMDRYNKDRSIKSSTLVKRAVAAQITSENMAEELRVLYVAMTRAKEKLILAGSGKLKNKWAKYERLAESAKDSSFHLNQLLGAGSFLDLLLMSMVEGEKHEGRPDKGYCICVKTAEDLAGSLVEIRHEEIRQQENLSHWKPEHIYNEEIRKNVQSSLAYEYPYRGDMGLKAKVSISDIKHKFMKQYDEDEEQAVELAGFPEEEVIPQFLKETGDKEMLSGASRGTAYHRVFELLDYGREFPDYQSVDSFLQELQEKQFITEEMRKCIYIKDILAFLQSSVGKRMKTAYKNGTLHREQQFVMGIPARELDTDYQGGETLLVQGIIDAYFEEDGKMCVVDYKTDFVESLNELDLRYHMQLQYYGAAVEQITGKKLHECIIYSVKFGQELKVLEND